MLCRSDILFCGVCPWPTLSVKEFLRANSQNKIKSFSCPKTFSQDGSIFKLNQGRMIDILVLQHAVIMTLILKLAICFLLYIQTYMYIMLSTSFNDTAHPLFLLSSYFYFQLICNQHWELTVMEEIYH